MGGGYISLTPLVGDVFMDRYLIQRLKFLRGVPEISGIGFTTNGAMAHRFDDPTLSDLLSAVTRIGISIYGISPDEYFEITRRKTYAKMKEGIRRIVSLSRVPVSLEFRLFERRTREEVCDWLRSEVFSADEYERLSDKVQVNSIITDYANWGVYDSDNTPLSHDATWFPSVRQERRPQCLIPIFAFMVFSNGSVSFCPCDNFNDVKELRIGNVMDSSLADIYASERVRDLWDWDRCGTPEFCKGCSFHIPLSILDHSPTILTDPHQIVGAG
jgi:MoaA/NifB/PqqE/SkfB family radical SAM enzyme